jgi:hypothetical protein
VIRVTLFSGSFAENDIQCVEILMETLLREERFILSVGGNDYHLRVEELIRGIDVWPERFRIILPASAKRKAAKFYGASALEVAELAARFLSSPAKNSA